MIVYSTTPPRPSSQLAALLPGPRTLWTLVGACAIPLWATWPLLAVLSTSIPLFEFLAIIFAVGAALLWLLPQPPAAPAKGGGGGWWRRVGLPTLMVAVGLLVSDVLFIAALRFIPAAEANLVLYLWPIIVAILGAALGLLVFRTAQIASIALGLAGAALVIGADEVSAVWQGIALAACGGLAWAVFVVFRMWQGERAPHALMPGFILSAALSLALHLGFETTVLPPMRTLICAGLVGVVPLALGNLAWDYGVRRGDRLLLAVLAYATPLVSTLILVASGFAAPSLGLFIGGGMIVAAGIIATR